MLSCLFLAGCGSAGKADNEKTVAESKIANESNINENGTEETTESESVKKDGDIDYDLTVMGADMVYATVYQMMIDPKSYIGKSFKIRGNYYSSYSNDKDVYYHFCMIKDAAACCAQGLEILWADEKMNRHENCPEEDTLVTVEGVFETYEEGPNTYGRIKDAKIVEE
ncbi:hypothetical protein HMPREF1495_0880 [Lachnoanaerobaculum sp. MSX33]|uniref:hypothetical protein n=1 Tax=Lachnoanaerobaculum sp. MSX33 TaxID=936596 RepID=UPI0003DFA223|nr:hypothetical protein [Lachnoanaerobaculum sp. MSX33]ETO97685.1 hypothetical protein HMPREF1495_0880 [Lachnoanaerobaculum sp. MSX33]RKW54480.1 MAG: hypothetical protein D8H95_09970 [Lachnospiraceae bacterium]